MAYAKDIFDFFNQTVKPIHNKLFSESFNAVPQIKKLTEQYKDGMQIAWLKLKLFD